MTTNWNKHTYVCNSCDGLIEATILETRTISNELCPACINSMTLLSVVDATISPTTTEEEQMETTEKTYAELYDNSATMIVKNTTSGELVYDKVSPYDVNCLITDAHLYKKKSNAFSSQIQAVKEIIIGAYEDSGDQDTLREIAEALDIELTKTIEWTATMYVSGSMEVNIFDDFDLDAELSDQLQVSAWSGDIEVEEYHVEDARES